MHFYEGKVFLFHREPCYDVVPLWDGHFKEAPIANLYERQTRCVFTNLRYIQDFLLGGDILVIIEIFQHVGQASLTENRNHNF